jgi:ABC-type multidrug transport system ATPase subunit
MSWGLEHVNVLYCSRSALADASVEVSGGAVTVLAGGDGSGKSTVLRAMVGLVRPSSGEVRRPAEERVGYQPASSGVYPDLTVRENLAFVGAAHGLSRAEIARRSEPLLERIGLTDASDRLGGQLSGGMRQKLGFALAILHRPDLLLLDEPTTGLDPVSRAELWRLIASEAARGAAILLATSYLDEADRAQKVVVLDRGRVLVAGGPSEVIDSVPGAVLIAERRPESALRWRRGRTWRLWSPDGEGPFGFEQVPPDLEDAVVVAALASAEGIEVAS